MPVNRKDFDQKFDEYQQAPPGSQDDLTSQQRAELSTVFWLTRGKKSIEPRPGFVVASRRRLVERVKKENQPFRQPTRQPAPPLSFFASAKRIVVQSVLAALLLVVLTANTHSIQASALASFPGDAFYPLKLAGEQTQLAFSFGAAKDAQLYTRFAQRRLADLAALVLEGHFEYLPATSEKCADQIDRAVETVQTVAQTDPAQARILAYQLEEMVFQQAEVLALLETAVPEGYVWTLNNVLAASRSGQLRLQTLFPMQQE